MVLVRILLQDPKEAAMTSQTDEPDETPTTPDLSYLRDTAAILGNKHLESIGQAAFANFSGFSDYSKIINQQIFGPGIAEAFAQVNAKQIFAPEVGSSISDAMAKVFEGTALSTSIVARLGQIEGLKPNVGLDAKLSEIFKPAGQSIFEKYIQSMPTIQMVDDGPFTEMVKASKPIELPDFGSLTAFTDPEGKLSALTDEIRLFSQGSEFTLPSISNLAKAYAEDDSHGGDAFESFAEMVEADSEWNAAIDAAVDVVKPPLIMRKYVRRLIVFGVFVVVSAAFTALYIVNPALIVMAISGIGPNGLWAAAETQKALDKRWPMPDDNPEAIV